MPSDEDGILPQQWAPRPSSTQIVLLGVGDDSSAPLNIEAEPPPFAAIGFPKDWAPTTQSFVMLPDDITPFPPPSDPFMSILSIEDAWTLDPALIQARPPLLREEDPPPGPPRISMATPLTQLAIRQQILEPWLAEVNSDFYTPAVIDFAINGEYKLFCAETLAGPVANFAETGTGIKRYWALPPEIVDIWRVDYGTGSATVEIPFMAFQNFSAQFGSQWTGVTTTGTPYAYCVMGDFSIGFHPIPDVTAFSITGPIVPDDLLSESDTLLVSSADAYTVAKRAYLWLVERNLSRGGQAPANYQRIAAEAKEETVKARERIHRLYGGIRVAGRVASQNLTSLVAGFGPRFAWP